MEGIGLVLLLLVVGVAYKKYIFLKQTRKMERQFNERKKSSDEC